MPAAWAESMMLWASASSVCGPKFMVPRQRRETFRPERPRWVYCMEDPFNGRPAKPVGGPAGTYIWVKEATAGSEPMRAPDSSAVMAEISSPDSFRDEAAKFSRMRPGFADLGMTMLPLARCQASTTWAVVASWAAAIEVTAFPLRSPPCPRGLYASTAIPRLRHLAARSACW